LSHELTKCSRPKCERRIARCRCQPGRRTSAPRPAPR
jgi:hypothetical protein